MLPCPQLPLLLTRFCMQIHRVFAGFHRLWLALADGLVAQGVCRFHRTRLALADTIAGAEQGISPAKAANEGQDRADSIGHQATN